MADVGERRAAAPNVSEVWLDHRLETRSATTVARGGVEFDTGHARGIERTDRCVADALGGNEQTVILDAGEHAERAGRRIRPFRADVAEIARGDEDQDVVTVSDFVQPLGGKAVVVRLDRRQHIHAEIEDTHAVTVARVGDRILDLNEEILDACGIIGRVGRIGAGLNRDVVDFGAVEFGDDRRAVEGGARDREPRDERAMCRVNVARIEHVPAANDPVAQGVADAAVDHPQAGPQFGRIPHRQRRRCRPRPRRMVRAHDCPGEGNFAHEGMPLEERDELDVAADIRVKPRQRAAAFRRTRRELDAGGAGRLLDANSKPRTDRRPLG